MEHTSNTLSKPSTRKDIQQQVTDRIIAQLEKGTVPWQQPWIGEERTLLKIPRNATTDKKYRGVNIVLLWSTALDKGYMSPEWASFKQWRFKNESLRKGEKGTIVVYYDTFEKDVDGEIKKIPFLKSSVVFNRCQLASWKPSEETEKHNKVSLVERQEQIDQFVADTKAAIEHHEGGACYDSRQDKVYMPFVNSFVGTDNCTATESYYSVLLHELTHWTGHSSRLNRNLKNRFGDKLYAEEELAAELGAAFMAAEFGISTPDKSHHASYIAHWLEVLKQNKSCLFTAASEASKAVDYMQDLRS